MKRLVILLCIFLLLTGCASNPSSRGGESNEQTQDVTLTTETYDPLERFNRGVYRFNARFDESIHYPVARGYQRITPAPVRRGVNNFFSNLGEVTNTANHLMQGRITRSARTAGRFAINSTLGLAGLFDVADRIGLEPAPTNFGRTLGRWGVGAGPYLVLPVVGPSSVRDGMGLATDFTINRAIDIAGLYDDERLLPLGLLYGVEIRSQLDFRYYQSGSPFEYEMVRFLYTRKRAIETDGDRSGNSTNVSTQAETFGSAVTIPPVLLVD